MEPVKETKNRNNRLSTKDFATAEERRDLNVTCSQMKDRNVESVTARDERVSATTEGHPQPAPVETPPLMKTEDEEDFRSRWNSIRLAL